MIGEIYFAFYWKGRFEHKNPSLSKSVSFFCHSVYRFLGCCYFHKPVHYPCRTTSALWYGFFYICSTISSLLLKIVYKQKRPKHWYQQAEITVGLSCVCGILLFPTISIFDTLFRAHPLRIVYYAEMATLFFWALLGMFFFGLYFKSKFDEEKKGESEMEQKSYTKGKDQLKW